MKIAIDADEQNTQIIQELLSPWNITYTLPEESDATLVYSKNSPDYSRPIVIPSDTAQFKRWVTDKKLNITKKANQQIHVKAASNLALTVGPEIVYACDNSVNQEKDASTLLAFDVISEYKRILKETLCAKASKSYTLFTKLPLPYNKVPKRFRDSILKQGTITTSYDLCNFLPMDALRFELVNKIEDLLNKKINRKNYGLNKKSVCAVTHDVDTRGGLLKSTKVKKLEETYNIGSAWYIPSAHYPLEKEIVASLANNGEVGSHDTKHDGRLSGLSGKNLSDRLGRSKKTLEAMANNPVVGFRAPLLQHTPNIISSLSACGYQYDTSIPTWEARHPRTMSPHGLGTVFPTSISGMSELPITIMQDHQFLYILGYKPKEVIATWLSSIAIIKELGGICILLCHPEYSLLDAQGLPLYEELLNTLALDNEMPVKLPKEICDLNKNH